MGYLEWGGEQNSIKWMLFSLRSLFLLTEHSSEVSVVSTLDSYCERITGVQQAGNGP